MTHSLDDVRALGYSVGVAHGAVDVEEAALAAARDRATPGRIRDEADQVAASVAQAAATYGLVGQELIDLVARATAQAIEALTVARSDEIEFHERAVEIAKATPTVYVIDGPGVHTVYVAVDDETGFGADEPDRETLALLTDPSHHKERCFQHYAPDNVVAAVLGLRAGGHTVDSDATTDGWSVVVDGAPVSSADDLVEAAKAARGRPKP